MLSMPKWGFTQAVLASSLLLVSQTTLAAPLYITTDITSTTSTLVNAGPLPVGPAVDVNVNNPLVIKAIGGSLTTTGASAIKVDNTIAAFGAPSIIVENSKTLQPADISSNISAIEINATGFSLIPGLTIQLLQGAVVQSTGVFPVISDLGTTKVTTLTLLNDGVLKNTGTGSVFTTGIQSTNVILRNTKNGVMQSGLGAVAIDFTNLAGPTAAFENDGQIISNGASAILSPNQVINPGFGLLNNATGLIQGKTNVINLTGQGTDVVNAGVITATDGPTGVAVISAGAIKLNGGSVTGILKTTLGVAGSIKVDVGSGKTFSTNGNLDAAGAGASVSVLSGTLRLNNNITNGNFTVSPGANVTVGQNITVAGSLTLIPGLPAPGSATFDIGSSQTGTVGFGQMKLGAVTNITNAQLNITTNANGYIANNAAFKIIDTGALALTTTGVNVNFPTSGIYSFATTLNPNDVTITVTRRALNTIYEPNTKLYIGGIAGTLETLGLNNTQEPDILRVLGELGRLPNFTQVEDAMRQLVPSTNQMEMQTTLSAPSAALDVVQNRLMALSTQDKNIRTAGGKRGDADEGYSAGSDLNSIDIWGQVFANHTDQKRRKNINGYKNDTGGFALGADTNVLESLRVGLGFSFSKTGARSKTIFKNVNNINTYQFIAYGAQDFGCGWIDAMVSFANMKYQGLRRINFGGINFNAKNRHRGAQWNSRIGYGYPFKTDDGWDFVPYADLGWSHVAEKAYAENSAGGLNLYVFSHNVDVVDASLKTKMSWTKETNFGKFIPSWYVGFKHDIVSKRDEVNVKLISTGSVFRVVGLDPTRFTLEYGVSLSLLDANGIHFSVDYDAGVKKDVFTQTGYLTARYAL